MMNPPNRGLHINVIESYTAQSSKPSPQDREPQSLSSSPVSSNSESSSLRSEPSLEQVNGCCRYTRGTLWGALTLIGLVATSGVMPGVAVGGCAIGLSIPMVLASMTSGTHKNGVKRNKEFLVDVVSAIGLSVLGILAISGVLPSMVLGWGLLIPAIAYLATKCCNKMRAKQLA